MSSITIANRSIGSTGFGLMSFAFLPADQVESHAFPAMRAAIAAGATFWNGGEFYGKIGGANSLTLLNSYFTKYPEDAAKVFLSIKGGMTAQMGIDGSPEGLRACVDRCLSQLPPSVKKIDLFEAARVDPKVPIETQIETLAELIKEGKISSIGLSEVSAASIRRAVAVHPIAAVEAELSMFETRNLSNAVLTTCGELGIPVIAYSPLGQGFLAGRFKARSDLPEGDPRLGFPRYSEENFPKNVQLVDKVQAFAQKKGCTAAQLALAWVRSFGEKEGYGPVLPLPGATTVERWEENFKSGGIKLTAEEDAEIEASLKDLAAAGPRYQAIIAHLMEG